MPDINNFKQGIKKEIDKIPPTTDNNLLAALSYVWVLSLLMLLFKRNDPFVLHHARQGFILNILTLVAWFPVLGWIVFALAAAGMVIGFIQAWQGKEYRVPYVYGWSQWLKSKGV